jgi:para-nitrobenzyl esterase
MAMQSTSILMRAVGWTFCLFLLIGVVLCPAHAQGIPDPAQAADSDPMVSVTGGQIRGRPLPGAGAQFLGIRYAQPPVGDLRWHEPVPVKPWDGVRDAKEFGAPCAQLVAGDWNRHDAETSQEDCLYLNVLTPRWPPAEEHWPVMLWIHGGANTGGTASGALYKDGTLVQHGVVLVTVNYRLGIFGFFAHPELTRESPHHASGNYALLDQIAALHWVHDNIAKFGGDPENITVFGQSAGALDTGLLMTSPLAKNLFHRAIAESGTVLLSIDAQPLAQAEQQGKEFADALNPPPVAVEDAIKRLRRLSAPDLLQATHTAKANVRQTGPIIDGWVLPRSPAEVFAAGEEAPIPFIVGNNTTEFAIPASPDQLRKNIGEIYGDLTPQALQVYGLANGAPGTTDPVYGPASGQWSADLIFRCPATAVAAWHSEAHHATYEYQFERAIPGQEAGGAVHSADLPYVWGYFPKHGNIGGVFGDTDRKLADLIENYWTTFAKTGKPSRDGLPPWPAYDDSQAYVAFTEDGQPVVKTQLRQAQCDIYRQSLKHHLKH